MRLDHGDLTEQVIGLFYDVYNELGHGFLESVYEQALVVACDQAGLQIQRQKLLTVWFRGIKVGDFRADVVVEDKLLLELKAARNIDKSHEAQLLHYLRCTEIEVGLLLNFGLRPQFRRLVFANARKKPGTEDFADHTERTDCGYVPNQ